MKKVYLISIIAVIFLAGLLLGYFLFFNRDKGVSYEQIKLVNPQGEMTTYHCLKKEPPADLQPVEYKGKTYLTEDSASDRDIYERTMINSIDNSPAPNYTPLKTKEEFKNLIADALGWNNLPMAKQITIASAGSYFDGNLFEDKIIYSLPAIDVRFLHAQHSEEKNSGRDLIIILHGHGSSAYKVMGLDNPDYMQKAGEIFFKEGLDVMAFDITSRTEESGYLNSQLLLYGVQIYGLWSRAVCDAVNGLDLNKKYSHIYLYGLSNGGVTADFISTLCPVFDKVIVEDILDDWRALIRKHQTLFSDQNYIVFFLSPLWFKTSYFDFIRFSGSVPKYYTRLPEVFDELLKGKIGLANGINNHSVNFVFKRTPFHAVETDLTLDIIREKNSLEGYHFTGQ